jgi:radical SAM superfamily enzyme YgiQ (UPF0313 family)
MSKGFSSANFPLGMAYVVAAIRKKFSEVEIRIAPFDLLQIDTEEEIRRELGIIAKEFAPDFVMFGGMITRYHYIVTLSRAVRKLFPDAVQILGGGAATWGHYLFADEAPIDFLTIGEAEETIISILTGNHENVPGILHLAKKYSLVEKQIISNVDTIPIPSHADFLIAEYLDIQKRLTGWRTMPIVASRGCPFHCHFCSPSTNRLRIRSVDNVIEEMKFLKNSYGADSIYFWDELQFVRKPWFEDLCRQMILQKLNLKWIFVTRATLVREKDIPLLKFAREAGCVRVAVGIESGSEAILKAMNKNTSVQEMADALRRVRKAGIKATGSMLLGTPGENKDTIQRSIDFANKNLLETSFYNLIPLPGAEVYERHCRNKKLIPDEKAYMYKVSLSGGDASNIIMNLTEMDDATYLAETARANKSVKIFGLRESVRYYGLLWGAGYMLNRKLLTINRKLSGRIFDTP